MCFFKVGDPLAPCEHEECKKRLQALQLSSCLYNNDNKPAPNSMIIKPQPQYVAKRSRPEASGENLTSKQEDVLLKKIKTDETPNEEIERKKDYNQNDQTTEECLMKLLAMNQNNSFAQAPNPHNFINLSSLQNQAIPLLTAPSTDNQFLTYLLMQNNQNNQNFNNMQGVFHDLSKNMNMQDPMFNIQLQMNSNSFRNSNNGINQNQIPYESNNNQAASQNVMLSKDFLNKIYNIITMQHKLITEIKDKNSLLFEGFGKLTSEFNEFKNQVLKIYSGQEETSPIQAKVEFTKTINQTPPSQSIPQQFNIIGVPGETITSRDLLHYLYAHKQEKFQYKLIQSSELELTLYRERNFCFSVCLVDFNDQPIANTNRIPLSVAIYTYENPPKCLDTNTSGSKILKGNIEKDLVNGYCSFEKIQIKEVTSHFRKGYVFLVVYPKMPTFGNLCSGAIQQNFVDFTTIKPLIIEKVVVKAKKINLFRTIDSLSQNLNENPNEIQNENPNENQYVSPNENLNDINISDVKDEIESEIKEKEIIYE